MRLPRQVDFLIRGPPLAGQYPLGSRRDLDLLAGPAGVISSVEDLVSHTIRGA